MSLQIKVKAGVPQKMDASDQPTFEQWMARVDGTLRKLRGLSVYDLPDCNFRDWYDARLRPIRACNRALKSAGSDY